MVVEPREITFLDSGVGALEGNPSRSAPVVPDDFTIGTYKDVGVGNRKPQIDVFTDLEGGGALTAIPRWLTFSVAHCNRVPDLLRIQTGKSTASLKYS